MKSIKLFFVAILTMAITVPAFAGDNSTIDSLIGAVVGGGGARALSSHVQSNSKRNMITGVGALAGAWAGNTIGDTSGQRHNDQMARQDRALDQNDRQYYTTVNQYQQQARMEDQQRYSRASNDMDNRQVTPVIINTGGDVQRQAPQTVMYHDVERYVPQEARREERHERRVASRDTCVDEEYFNGEYNPEAAVAFCRGTQAKKERQARVVHDAYLAGLNSN